MASFMLDCDSVTEVGSSLSALVSRISDISSSVSGYDTSCEDGFDFASAKSSIAANIEACSSKVQNTAKLIENVVSSHTSLQSSIASGNLNSDKKESGDSATKSSSGGRATSGGGSYSGGGSSSGGGGGSYSRPTTMAAASSSPAVMETDFVPINASDSLSGSSTNMASSVNAAVSAGVAAGIVGSAGENVSEEGNEEDVVTDENNEEDIVSDNDLDSKKVEDTVDTSKGDSNSSESSTGNSTSKVVSNIDGVDYVSAEGVSNDVIKNIKYNKDGYGLIGSKRVISCNSSLGKIGDAVTIKQPDGTKIECVIGNVTDNNKISFYVDKTKLNITDSIDGLVTDGLEVANRGRMTSSVISRTTTLNNNQEIEILGEDKGEV